MNSYSHSYCDKKSDGRFLAPFGSFLNFEFLKLVNCVHARFRRFILFSSAEIFQPFRFCFLISFFPDGDYQSKARESCFMVLGHKMGISIYFNKLTRRQLTALLRYSPFKVIVCFLNHDAQRSKSSQQREWRPFTPPTIYLPRKILELITVFFRLRTPHADGKY